MTLSSAQLDARTRGLGSSDIPALVLEPHEVPGRRGPTDVWLSKRRGPALELDPLCPPTEDAPIVLDRGPYHGSPLLAGTILEDGIVQLYEAITGRATRREGTMVHPEHPWALATPDRILLQGKCGLECKLVGQHMAHHWDDGIPPAVVVQVQWAMAVTGLDHWDVAALLGGSTPFVDRVDRDRELGGLLLESARAFWEVNVLGNVAPLESPRAARRVAELVHRSGNGVLVPADTKTDELVELLCKAKDMREQAQEAEDAARDALCAAVGPNDGIEGHGWRFTWRAQRGRTDWKAVAEELGATKELAEKHRGAGYRVARLWVAKEK